MRRTSAVLACLLALPVSTAVAGQQAEAATRSVTGPIAVKEIVYRHGASISDSDLWTMNADGSGKAALPKSTAKNATTINSGAGDGSPYMSPDGGWLAFTSNRTGSNHVWVANLATGVARDLTPAGGGAGVGWYVDETGAARIVYVVGTSPGPYQLWSVKSDGSGTRPVTNTAYPMGRSDITTDGKIAVAGDLDASGQRKIWVAQITSTPLTWTSFTAYTTPASGQDDNSPAWSPSGALAFMRGPSGQPAGVVDLLPPAAVESTTTPAQTVITQGQEPGLVFYSRDGSQLDYTTNPDGNPNHNQIWVTAANPSTGVPTGSGVQVTQGSYGDWQGSWR